MTGSLGQSLNPDEAHTNGQALRWRERATVFYILNVTYTLLLYRVHQIHSRSLHLLNTTSKSIIGNWLLDNRICAQSTGSQSPFDRNNWGKSWRMEDHRARARMIQSTAGPRGEFFGLTDAA